MGTTQVKKHSRENYLKGIIHFFFSKLFVFFFSGHLVVSKPTLQHWLRKSHSVGIVHFFFSKIFFSRAPGGL